MAKNVRMKDLETVKNVSVRLFHISFDGELGSTLEPRLPYGDDPREDEEFADDGLYPEPNVPRVSFSPSLRQCFRAVYPNVSHFFEEHRYPNMDFHVYEAILTGRERIVLPEYLTKERMVWDAHITDEHWSLDPVKVERIGAVRFYRPRNDESLQTHPFNDRRLPKKSNVGPKDIEMKVSDRLKFDQRSLESHCPRNKWLMW